mgnify:CR=1 FL=1
MENTLDLLQTTEEKMFVLANKVRQIRKSKKLSQEKLALMSNVSFGSIKRFEQTGEISLYSLVKITNCLKIKIDIIDLNEDSVKIEGFYNAK